MKEIGRSGYQYKLKKKLEAMFPGCVILRNDPQSNFQGVPDLTILYKDKWATLEVKRSAKAPRQPNQVHYIEKFDEMSFAAFIHPGNEEEVLGDLQLAFSS